jgi:hypothetical protein
MGKPRTERGQGMLELAVILPVLLILLMGLVEIGYALRDYLVVVNACREGCPGTLLRSRRWRAGGQCWWDCEPGDSQH